MYQVDVAVYCEIASACYIYKFMTVESHPSSMKINVMISFFPGLYGLYEAKIYVSMILQVITLTAT